MNAGNINDNPFTHLVEAIVAGDDLTAIRLLDASPQLTKERPGFAATQQYSERNFFDRIRHYIYEGDTALHMAAAAFQTGIVEELITKGADVRPRNRRGAEPLHYAVDGGPDGCCGSNGLELSLGFSASAYEDSRSFSVLVSWR